MINWKTEKRKIADLKPFEDNPRYMTEKQAEDLRSSLDKFGLVEIPVINLDNTILAGHMRIRTLQDMGRGEEEIEVRVPDRMLDMEEAMEYLLRSNKNTGSWDWGKLKDFGTDNLVNFGFDDAEIKMNIKIKEIKADLEMGDRYQILQVLPPNSPKLSDRAYIEFADYDQYLKVKEAIEAGKITDKTIYEIL